MTEQKKKRISPLPGQLPVNQETLDILVANIIPTSKYFEARFDHMENRVERIQSDLIDFRKDVDRRFDGFKSDADKRFEQVDKRFEQMIISIDKLTDKLDHRDERQRNFTLRMFTISITISILGATGAFLKALAVF